MKQKINYRLIMITIIAVIATALTMTIGSYQILKERVLLDLKTEAAILDEAGMEGLANEGIFVSNDDIRITWIDKDGQVLYDNDVTGLMQNHMHRPEVENAFLKGDGIAIRNSDTMKTRTFYYARLLDDGTVLRVSTEAKSIFNIFFSAVPYIVPLLVVIVSFCIIIGNLLTQNLLKPIKEMADDLDSVQSVDEYKELEPFINRIREQHGDILAAAKSRQDFSANVSHELKTPITAISGYAELISMSATDDQTHYFAEAIRKNSNRLVSLVNDIIKLSELDHSERIMEFSKVDMYTICEERVELLKNNGRDRNVKLILEGEPCKVMSTPGLLTELVDNIVQNAIRYNVESGTVKVSVYKEDNHGILKVEDTGIGIPKEDQQRVFERFYRVDKSRSRDTGGTGLGLAIVKHIVELHEGRIELQSEIGKGTTITIEL